MHVPVLLIQGRELGEGRASSALELHPPAGPANPCPGGMLPSMGDYVAINKAMWDERAPVHAVSAHYGFDRFIGDAEHISGVVRFDRPRLGDVTGQRGVHLQCHIGTDTLSLGLLRYLMVGRLDRSVPCIRPRARAQRRLPTVDASGRHPHRVRSGHGADFGGMRVPY
jgi:hypothetical protein